MKICKCFLLATLCITTMFTENFTCSHRCSNADGDDDDVGRLCLEPIDRESDQRQTRIHRLTQCFGVFSIVIAFLYNIRDGSNNYSQTSHAVLGEISQRPQNISMWVVIYVIAWQIVLSERFRQFAAALKRYFTSRRLRVASSGSLSRTTIHTSATNFAKMVRVSSTETIARFSSAVKLLSVASTRKRCLWIGERDSFLPINTISSMTLKDIAALFQFLLKSTQHDFNRDEYFESCSEFIQHVIEAIELACYKSKGITNSYQNASAFTVGKGDVDALLFAAIIRIFAEWRYVRLVPDGYKRYSVGMALARRDLLQNIAKLEQAVHTWLDHMTPSDERLIAPLPSPTLRQILRFEVEQGMHPKLPRLTDKSGANGLLWIYRQLMYQSFIFANTMEVPTKFPVMKAAVTAAYQEAYGPYHSWPVQQIFQQSFRAAPDLQDLLKCMIPERRKPSITMITGTAVKPLSIPSTADSSTNGVCEHSVETKILPLGKQDLAQELHQVFLGFTADLCTKWSRFLDHLNCLPENGNPIVSSIGTTPLTTNETSERKTVSRNTVVFAPATKLRDDDWDTLKLMEGTSEALLQIAEFQIVATPMLQCLKKLISVDFNMNDPSRI